MQDQITTRRSSVRRRASVAEGSRSAGSGASACSNPSHAEVAIASLVTAADYRKPLPYLCDPSKPASDHKTAKLSAKQLKHGNRDIPLVLDVTGAIEPRSHAFRLSQSQPTARLRSCKLLVAAAMRRLSGRLDAGMPGLGN